MLGDDNHSNTAAFCRLASVSLASLKPASAETRTLFIVSNSIRDALLSIKSLWRCMLFLSRSISDVNPFQLDLKNCFHAIESMSYAFRA